MPGNAAKDLGVDCPPLERGRHAAALSSRPEAPGQCARPEGQRTPSNCRRTGGPHPVAWRIDMEDATPTIYTPAVVHSNTTTTQQTTIQYTCLALCRNWMKSKVNALPSPRRQSSNLRGQAATAWPSTHRSAGRSSNCCTWAACRSQQCRW